jgi:hypothetical protein
VLFASLAGYYFCFWKVKQPVIKIVLLVVFPTVVSLVGAICFFYRAALPSILVRDASGLMMRRWIISSVGDVAAGLQLCFADCCSACYSSAVWC